MIRFILLVLVFSLFATARSYAQPSNQICGGHFERYLKGYWIGKGELDHFLQDQDALAACRLELDSSNDEHVLIDAYILWKGVISDSDAAVRLFESVCERRNGLACYYIRFGPSRRYDNYDDSKARKDRAALIEPPLPLSIGRWRLTGTEPPAFIAHIKEQLRRASDWGDWWATENLIHLAADDGPDGLPEVYAYTLKAAEQGHVPSLNELAKGWLAVDHHVGAIEFLRRAANADPRWFRADIARAQYLLGMLLREGERTPRNPIEARRWLQSAAALGNTQAKRELERDDGR